MHWCTVLLTLAAPVLSLPASPRATASMSRALWLWTSDIIKDSASISTFLSVATSADNGFGTVYALIDRDMGIPAWQSFVAKCNASGIAVGALMGDPQWVLGRSSEDCPTLQHELDWLAQYQASVPANAKFANIHLDVEPWSLDGWEANKKTYVDSYLSIVEKVSSFAKPLNLPVAADLPFWSNTVPCGDATLDVCVLEHLDSVTFMTYRNTASALLDIATPLLKAAGEAHPSKKVWLSVETTANIEDAELISFAGKGVDVLRESLAAVEAGAAQFEAFGGIAVHDYAGFSALA